MSEKNIAAIKERLKVDLEKLKITVTIIVLLTGGLIGLLYKNMRELLNIVLFITGLIMEIIFVSYVTFLNGRLKSYLGELEVTDD